MSRTVQFDSFPNTPYRIQVGDSVRIVFKESLLDDDALRIRLLEDTDHVPIQGLSLTEYAEKLLSKMSEIGYPFIRIQLTSIEILDSHNEIPIAFESIQTIKEKKYSIHEERYLFEFKLEPLAETSSQKIRFEGNSRLTQAHLVSFLKPVFCTSSKSCVDELLDKEGILKVIQRLGKVQGLESSTFSAWSVEHAEDGIDVKFSEELRNGHLPKASTIIRVQEKKVSQLDGVLGLTNQEGATSVMGNIQLSVPILTGNGIGLRASFSRFKPLSTRSSIHLSKQMLSSLPFDLALDYSMYQEDSLYLESSIGSSLIWNGSSTWSADTRIRYQQVRSGASLMRNEEIDRKDFFAGYGVHFIPFGVLEFSTHPNPITGFSSTLFLEHSMNSNRQIKIAAEVRSAFEIIQDQWVLFLSGKFESVHEDEIPYSSLIQVGGPRDFPGLNPAQFRVKRRIQSNSQLRWNTGPDLWFHVFSSNAVLSVPERFSSTAPSNPEFSTITLYRSKIIHSLGAGMGIKTRSGLLVFSAAWSSADRFDQGKIVLTWNP